MSSFQGERIEVNPRRTFRERQQANKVARGPEERTLTDPPPTLLGPPSRAPVRQLRDLAPEPELPDPEREVLRLRVRPGHRHDARARVRVYHVLLDRLASDPDARCWAFTISRRAYERLVTERILDADGATYPDGTPCVPPGVDPMDVAVQCGSCGTTTVDCLHMQFFED